MSFDPVTAIAAVTAVVGVQQGAQARKESKRASKAKQAIAAKQAQREKLAQLRESQIQRARAIQAGATGGAGDSSMIEGTVSSIGSQTASNIGFINQIQDMQKQVAYHQQKAADFGFNAQAVQAVGNLAVSAMGSVNTKQPTSTGVTKSATTAPTVATNTIGSSTRPNSGVLPITSQY